MKNASTGIWHRIPNSNMDRANRPKQAETVVPAKRSYGTLLDRR
jgi:hypothetical protein